MKSVIKLSCGLLIACLLPSSVLADTASTTQDINLLVPVVALLDIGDVTPQFNFQTPQNAGDGLTLTATNNIFTVALSSNNSLAKLDVKVSQDLAPHGLSLILDNSTLSGCTSPLTLSTSDQTYCTLGTQQVTDSSPATITLNAATTQSMAAYGSYSVQITYTLTDN